MVCPEFQPMRVSEEPVYIYLFRQNPVFISLHLRSPVHFVPPQSRNLKSCYGARNRFQEPSLELSNQATYRLAARYDNPMPTWLLAPIAGLKLPAQIKGTVQRELRWVKIGINRTARIKCIAGNCHLPCPNGHHHERSFNVIGGCSTF